MKYKLTLNKDLFNIIPLNKTVRESIDQEGYKELLASFYLPSLCSFLFKTLVQCEPSTDRVFICRSLSPFSTEIGFQIIGPLANLRKSTSDDLKLSIDKTLKDFIVLLLQDGIKQYNEAFGDTSIDPHAGFKIELVSANIAKFIKQEES
jgi:hypothetical protein